LFKPSESEPHEEAFALTVDSPERSSERSSVVRRYYILWSGSNDAFHPRHKRPQSLQVDEQL
jgi:hypothetical protein